MTTQYTKSLKRRMLNDELWVDDSSGTPVLKDGKDRVIGGGSGGGVNWGEIGGTITNQGDMVDYVTGKVNTEGTARQAADTELQGNIDTEAATRAAAITLLQTALTGKVDTETLNTVVAQFTEEIETIYSRLRDKQDTLIPGTNITIVDNVISATGGSAPVWGDITGDINSQKDLGAALSDKASVSDLNSGLNTERDRAMLAEQQLNGLVAEKQDILIPGTNITIVDNVISASGTGEAVWGSVTGRIGDQTDLMDLFGTKAAAADLLTETTTRANADTALQGNIDINTAAISGLTQELGSEVTARANGDSTLQSNIDAEAGIRENHDVALENSINGESQIREAADTALQTAINGKQDTLTTAQLAAANSGITATKVSTYDGYASQISGKQSQITYGTEDPTGGNPGDVYIKIAA